MVGRILASCMSIVVLNFTWHEPIAVGGDDWILGLQGKNRWTYGQYTQWEERLF